VLVHEFGHYITARWVGIKVEEFAIGMGPKIWGKKIKSAPPQDEIEYTVRALPIGGYVKMYGQEDYDMESENSFGSKKPSKRLIVLLAGVFMNLFLAIILFYAQGAHQDFKYRNLEGIVNGEFKPWFGDKTEPKVAIGEVTETSPLKGKVNSFDIITKINGEDYKVENFRQIVEDNKGKELTFDLLSYNSTKTTQVKVTPRVEVPENEGPLGIAPLPISFIEFNGASKLFAGVGQSFNTIQNFGFGIKQLVSKSFADNSIVPVADNVGGAIGIFEALNKIITAFGFWGVLELAALFSINLAVFNILPIPALDGGHVLFTLIEMISRKRLHAKVYNYLTIGGFVLLMGFMVFITGLDLVKHTRVRDKLCPNESREGFLCKLTDYR
jgi:regulator of sigma E protease